jgi:hypothetical protein
VLAVLLMSVLVLDVVVVLVTACVATGTAPDVDEAPPPQPLHDRINVRRLDATAPWPLAFGLFIIMIGSHKKLLNRTEL